MTDAKALMIEAQRARLYSYSPYSHFCVGAALLTKSGKIYTGCNIENAAFTPTVCAERIAVFKAISEGECEFEAIAIVGGRAGKRGGFCPPCGVCRQVLAEFCSPDLKIYLGDEEHFEAYTLDMLLPLSFNSENL